MLGFSFLLEGDLDDSLVSVEVEIFPGLKRAFAKFSSPCEREECEGLCFRLGVLCGHIVSQTMMILSHPIVRPVPCERCDQLCSLKRVDEINVAIIDKTESQAWQEELDVSIEEHVLGGRI